MKVVKQVSHQSKFNIAICYQNGKGVNKSPKAFIYFMKLDATHCNPIAASILVVCYNHGKAVNKI
jgi:TPR repeat protein